MKKAIVFLFLSVAAFVFAEERIEDVPFGDFEHWTVRYIKEAALLGGKTKTLYMIGPTDTIRSNKPFVASPLSPWGSGNAHAKAFGVDKVSVSVVPERRGDGWCCRMESVLEIVRAVGIDLKALATGSIYTGHLMDPVDIRHGSDPASAIDMGMPFTGRPNALMLDYKAYIQEGEGIVFANAGTRVKSMPGHDEGMVSVILQYRWEEKGHVYAYRVGTGTEHFAKSTNGWVNEHRVPIWYGDITKRADFSEWDALSKERHHTHNSHGKMVAVEEIGWRGDLKPTHIVIQVGAGCQKPFTGRPGNIVWCDNLKLVY